MPEDDKRSPVGKCKACKMPTRTICVICGVYLCAYASCVAAHYSQQHSDYPSPPEPACERVNEEQLLLQEEQTLVQQLEDINSRIEKRAVHLEAVRGPQVSVAHMRRHCG